jgi:hypothetical protein
MDQILNCVFAIRQLSTSRFSIDFSGLGPQTLHLVHGRAQEKTELMHLHTTTHGTKRWSGDRELLGDASEEQKTPPEQFRQPRGIWPSAGKPLQDIHSSTKRSGSPVRPRAASPVRGPNSTPVWHPHMKPAKPAPKTAAKRIYSNDDVENDNNFEAVTGPTSVFKPAKPVMPKSALKRSSSIEEPTAAPVADL